MTGRNQKQQVVLYLVITLILTCTPVSRLFTSHTAAAVILFLETGHILRLPPETQPPPTVPPSTTSPPQTIPPETTTPTVEPDTTPPETVPTFSPSDASLVEVNSYCGYEPDVPTWLAQPLSWDLKQPEPTVLILHSHGTESYKNTENTGYRSQNRSENLVSVGDALASILEQAGIGVVHDRAMHDHPSYSDAYANSRESAQKYLEKYPSVKLILDLHRDSVEDSSGNQIPYTLETANGRAAKMMFVVGTDAGGLAHSKWSENMSLAVKLHALLEKKNPGICRPISFRTQRFNQDLSTGALLVEMGAAGNTRQEALLAAELLADAIIDLAKGTV